MFFSLVLVDDIPRLKQAHMLGDMPVHLVSELLLKQVAFELAVVSRSRWYSLFASSAGLKRCLPHLRYSVLSIVEESLGSLAFNLANNGRLDIWEV